MNGIKMMEKGYYVGTASNAVENLKKLDDFSHVLFVNLSHSTHSYGMLIKHVRTIRGQTQKEVADILGVSKESLGYWERNERKVSDTNRWKAERYLSGKL